MQPLIESTATTCIGITTKKEATLALESSKFGGFPYIPEEMDIPIDGQNQTMRLLAQINFAELPHLELLPKEGLLQFYISEDEIYGLDFDNPISQKGWKVLFFEKLDFTPRKNFGGIYQDKWASSPLLIAPLSLAFKLKKDYPNYPSIEYYQHIQPLFEKIEEGDYVDFLEDLYIDRAESMGHKIGGYPYYTQNEIREFKKHFSDYQLLLQIDSDGDKIMWGDVGVANFFIKKEDLIKKDFSKVLYNWDCH